VLVSPSNPLSAGAGASILFAAGAKIATSKANPVDGFLASGTSTTPVYLMGPFTEP
jgi:hypothetical protein